MAEFVFKSSKELDEEENKVINAARLVISTSYSPYSKFAVGAAVLLANGEIIIGSNQENMAYPSGICAERAALFSYGSQGIASKIIKLGVFAMNHQSESMATSTPCGACRQVMLEFELKQESEFEVVFFHNNKYVISSAAKLLLTFHFHI